MLRDSTFCFNHFQLHFFLFSLFLFNMHLLNSHSIFDIMPSASGLKLTQSVSVVYNIMLKQMQIVLYVNHTINVFCFLFLFPKPICFDYIIIYRLDKCATYNNIFMNQSTKIKTVYSIIIFRFYA